MHTGSRNINTKEEVVERLEKFPETEKILSKAFSDNFED